MAPRSPVDGRSMPSRLSLVVIALGLLLTAPGSAVGDDRGSSPTTRPATRWADVVNRLAVALVDSHARQEEDPLFLPEAHVQPLPIGEVTTPAALRGLYDGHVVLSAGSFVVPQMNPAATLGADLALAAKQHKDTPAAIPPVVVTALTPPDPSLDVAGATAAEMAASRWLISTLDCNDGDRVGLIVLWQPIVPTTQPATDAFSAARAESDYFRRLSFVVLLGRQDALGRWRIAVARHGTAEQVLAQPAKNETELP